MGFIDMLNTHTQSIMRNLQPKKILERFLNMKGLLVFLRVEKNNVLLYLFQYINRRNILTNKKILPLYKILKKLKEYFFNI